MNKHPQAPHTTPPATMSVCIVLPTFNEAENLSGLIQALNKVRESAEGIALSAVVVDDNSPDGTGHLADNLARQHSWLDVIHRSGRQGLGSAYIEGFTHALRNGSEACIQMDCDFSHDPRDIPRMISMLSSENPNGGADLVIGSRYTAGGETVNWSLWRRSISKLGSLYARTVLGLEVRDLTSGFKCIRSGTLELLDLQATDSRGYGINIELTYAAIKRGARVVEIPITFVDRCAGESKMSLGIVLEAGWKVPMLRLRALSEDRRYRGKELETLE